jgi:MOSC domain-containing protein YiiM
MSAQVVEILSAATQGAGLLPRAQAILEAGRGLVGDRYHFGVGTFSAQLGGKPDAQLTLIEDEEIQRFNGSTGLSLRGADLRRNIVTRGVRLNELVGKEFTVGGAVLRGLRLCEPCAHLASLANPRVLPGLVHRAGLRAQVLVGAVIQPGDPIAIAPAG